MMRSLFLIPLVVISVALHSCRKKSSVSNRSYTGVIVDTAGNPLNEATITLMCRLGNFGGWDEDICSQDVTDADGRFTMSVKLKNGDDVLRFNIQSASGNLMTFNDTVHTSLREMRIVYK